MSPLFFELTRSEIRTPEPEWADRFGAEVVFYGVVRGLEDGEPIAGIEYSAYEEMANRVAGATGAEASRRFGEHRARLIHRLGFVAVAQPSVSLEVGAPHGAEALEICGWYLGQLKTEIPIWKRFV